MCAGNWRRTQDANAPHELGRIGRIWLGFRRYALHKVERLVACFSRFPWLAMDAIDTNIIHSSCWTVKRKWQVLSHWNGAAVYGCLCWRLLAWLYYIAMSRRLWATPKHWRWTHAHIYLFIIHFDSLTFLNTGCRIGICWVAFVCACMCACLFFSSLNVLRLFSYFNFASSQWCIWLWACVWVCLCVTS